MAIPDLIRDWDGEHVVLRYDRSSGAWIIVAIHSTVMGPATGGTRFLAYPDANAAVADALRLSAGMTLKYAVADFPRGGGKAVIYPTRPLASEEREGVLERYGALVQELAGGFWTGPDVGTSSADMDVIAHTADPYVFSRTEDSGGAGSSGPFTALGVLAGVEAACERVFGGSEPLKGRTVLVQGLGSVGAPLAQRLHDAGARLLVSDVAPEKVAQARAEWGAEAVNPEEVSVTLCDVYAPCALGGVVTRTSARRLGCRIVAGGANNQLTDANLLGVLGQRGVLYIPDFAINAGGAMAITGMEALGWSAEQAAERVRRAARSAVLQILDRVERGGGTTEEAARALARERLHQAGAPGS